MSIYWLNGVFHDGTAPEREVEGVFDTLLAAHGQARYYAEHMDRLMHDAKIVLDLSPTVPDVIGGLLSRNELGEYARVRTSVTREMVLIEAFPCPDPAALGPTTAVIIEDWPRVVNDPLENCKRLDYSRNFSARDKAVAMGAENAILLNNKGHIACGHVANLFIEENGVLITPPLSEGVLAGVTRKHLIAQGAREEPITKERLITADKAFLSNSLIGLRPVTLLRSAA